MILLWISIIGLSAVTIANSSHYDSDVYTAGAFAGIFVAFVVAILGLITYKRK